MALIDKASLLMVPSTYEAGKLYNVLPSGNRAPDSTGENSGYDQTRADFDFDRGSNTAATRVNADGLIEKYRENLFTESNNFSDSDWTPKAGTFTQGVEDPNGGNTAWSWTASNTDPYLYQAIGTSGVFTLSIYAKGVGSTIGKVLEFRNGSTTQNFTLTSEWQRFELYAAAGGSNIGFEFGNPAVAGDVLHIYAAQWETGMVATEYLESTSVTGKAGVLIDLPRIDYSSGAGALLLEPSRINAYLHSDYLYNFNGDETFNHATSPEGVSNATLLTKTSASDQFINMAWTGTTIAASSDYTMSIFVKHNGDDVNVRYEYNNSNDWGGVAWTALFEVRASGVTKSTAGNCTSDVEDYGNGWFRLKVFVTTGASITASSPANLFRVIGASGETLLVYGAQMEKGSYSTSLIPTYGTGVTRAADSCNGGGSAESINSTEGVLYAEISGLSTDPARLSISDGTNNNNIYIELDSSNVNAVGRVGGSNQFALSSSQTITNNNKVAIKYKANDFSLYINGTEVATDTSGNTYSANTLTSLQFNRGDGGVLFYGNVKQVAVFNEALSDSELATLTTL